MVRGRGWDVNDVEGVISRKKVSKSKTYLFVIFYSSDRIMLEMFNSCVAYRYT